MKKILSLVLLLSFNSLWAIDTSALSQFPLSEKPVVVRAYYSRNHQIQALSKFITPWEVNTEQMYAVLSVDDNADFSRLKKLGFELRIDSKLQAKILKDQKRVAVKGSASIAGYACYSTVEDTFARIDTMAANYPDFTEVENIGVSWEKSVNANNGYDMRVLKITNKNIVDDDKPILFISSAIHAREYATAELNTRFAEYLLANYASNSDIKWMLDYQEVHFLLHNNPDGRKKAEQQLGGHSGGWRKNTNTNYCGVTSNRRGSDLNRNFPFGWESSNDQCSAVYSGSSAESEPEISAIVEYFNYIWDDNRGPNFNDAAPDDTSGVFVDVHSYSQLILWPWGYTGSTSANQAQFAAFGKRVAYFNDYKPQTAAELYTAKGVSIDTSYGDLGVASIVYELGTAFYQDCEEFENKILPDNLASLLYVSRVTRTPYITPFGPDIEDLLIVPNVVLATDDILVAGKANDDRYNHSNGVQAIGQVQAVEYYVNDLPWLTANGVAITANDGAFDSELESFNGVLNAADLTMGENIIYVTATDNDDKDGAVFSKFVNVVDENQVGQLSGRVIDAVTGVAINGAKFTFNNSFALSNNIGLYSQYVNPATDNLKITADNYAPLQIDDITIIAQQQLTQDVMLEPYCSLYSDDVESGVGFWQAQSPWAISQEQAASGNSAWTDSPNAQYANNISTSLTSGAIDITTSESLLLSFNHVCDTEAGYDYGHVEVNFDNTSWQEIFNCNAEASWKSEQLSVDVPNNAQSLQLRFRLTTDQSVTRTGWFVDDIEVKVSGALCHFEGSDRIFIYGFES